MEALRIGSFHARYRLARSERATRERLDRLLAEMLDERLEDALAAAGVDASEEICVRRVDAPVRVRLASGDASLAAEWAAAVAAAIGAAIRAGGPGVVRYGSRRHALLDLVLGVAHGRLARAWAWRRLGLWPADAAEPGSDAERARLALAELRAEPAAVVPVLAAVAHEDAGAVARLLASAGPASWRALADAALAAAGIDPAALAAAVSNDRWRTTGDERAAASAARAAHERSSAVPRPAAETALERAVVTARLRVPAAGAADDLALAVLVALAADRAPHGTDRLAADVRAIARKLQSVAWTRRPADDEPPAAERGGAATAASDEPDDARKLQSVTSADAVTPSQTGARRAHGPAAAGEADDADEPAPLPARPSATTAAGGLLYLLNVVDELALVDDLPAERPLRWSLHALALLLAPLERDDPAALAFCGLAPDAEPPDERTLAATAEEAELLESAASRIVLHAAELLDPDGEPDDVVASLVARHAELVADPGWLDVRLRLEDVTTELRRSGLDVDPGWLPWLGCVVRFVYA